MDCVQYIKQLPMFKNHRWTSGAMRSKRVRPWTSDEVYEEFDKERKARREHKRPNIGRKHH